MPAVGAATTGSPPADTLPAGSPPSVNISADPGPENRSLETPSVDTPSDASSDPPALNCTNVDDEEIRNITHGLILSCEDVAKDRMCGALPLDPFVTLCPASCCALSQCPGECLSQQLGFEAPDQSGYTLVAVDTSHDALVSEEDEAPEPTEAADAPFAEPQSPASNATELLNEGMLTLSSNAYGHSRDHNADEYQGNEDGEIDQNELNTWKKDKGLTIDDNFNPGSWQSWYWCHGWYHHPHRYHRPHRGWYDYLLREGECKSDCGCKWTCTLQWRYLRRHPACILRTGDHTWVMVQTCTANNVYGATQFCVSCTTFLDGIARAIGNALSGNDLSRTIRCCKRDASKDRMTAREYKELTTQERKDCGDHLCKCCAEDNALGTAVCKGLGDVANLAVTAVNEIEDFFGGFGGFGEEDVELQAQALSLFQGSSHPRASGKFSSAQINSAGVGLFNQWAAHLSKGQRAQFEKSMHEWHSARSKTSPRIVKPGNQSRLLLLLRTVASRPKQHVTIKKLIHEGGWHKTTQAHVKPTQKTEGEVHLCMHALLSAPTDHDLHAGIQQCQH